MSRYTLSKLVKTRLEDLDITAEDVIKKALGIKDLEGWTADDGTFLPNGTQLLKWYKDRLCGAIVKDGAFWVDGKTSVNNIRLAAVYFTEQSTTNGWDWWSVKLPDSGEFVPAQSLRAEKKADPVPIRKSGAKKYKSIA